jgi:hypothetical protein
MLIILKKLSTTAPTIFSEKTTMVTVNCLPCSALPRILAEN